MSALSDDDRTRLGKLLNLLSSPHVGERGEAAAAADRFIKARNLTWDEVLRPPADPTGRYPYYTDTFAGRPSPAHFEVIQWCLSRGGFLSKWERDFLRSVVDYHLPRLSRNQQGVLDDIVTKIKVELRGTVA